jgi:hypothetical protein
MQTAKDFVAWLEGETAARVTESPAGSNRIKYWGAVYPSWQGSPWCLAFIIAGLRAIGLDKTAAPDIYSCTDFRAWAQKNKRWIATKDIRSGDVVLFDFDNKPDRLEHVGACISVNTTTRTAVCIEGNTSYDNKGSQSNGGCVARKVRELTLIVGAYRPPYKIEGDDDMTQEQYETMYKTMIAKKHGAEHSAWADDVIKKAVSSGAFRGNNGDYEWKDPLTREELAVVLDRLGLLK